MVGKYDAEDEDRGAGMFGTGVARFCTARCRHHELAAKLTRPNQSR
jgi:hypothetical protein